MQIQLLKKRLNLVIFGIIFTALVGILLTGLGMSIEIIDPYV